LNENGLKTDDRQVDVNKILMPDIDNLCRQQTISLVNIYNKNKKRNNNMQELKE